MAINRKGPNGGDREALKKCNADKGNSSTDGALDLTSIGLHLLTGRSRAAAVKFIHRAMIWGDKFVEVRKNRADSFEEFHTIVLDCNFNPLRSTLLTVGWEPGNKMTASELESLCFSIGQTGHTCEKVANQLRDVEEAKTMLASGVKRRIAAEEMTRELNSISEAVWPVVDTLQIPSNWRGAVPNHALVYGTEVFLIPEED